MNRPVAGRKLAPGTDAQINLKVSETTTHRDASIPITVVRGVEDGPVLTLTGAVHGDEINGIAIVRRILDIIEPDSLRGTLVGVPVVNRFGFINQSRYLPDRRDLNRFFPGDPDGSMAGRIAHKLFDRVISRSDFLIDLHTAAAGQQNLCHVRGDADDPRVKELMKAFGTPVMMHGAGPKGSLRRAALEAGIPSILFEAGEPARFQEHVVEIGAEGVLRVMKHLGMIDRRLRKPGVQVLMRRTEWIRADHGGLLYMEVEPGDLVRTRQRLATIHDPFGRRVDGVYAQHSGVVLSTATVPLVNPGTAVAHVGILHKTFQRAQKYVRDGGDMGHVNWLEAKREQTRKRKKAAAAKKVPKTAAKPTNPTKASKATRRSVEEPDAGDLDPEAGA